MDRNDIERVYALKLDDLYWKPIYPNNMSCNGIIGYYTLILIGNPDGTISGRKYSIVFQKQEVEPGKGLVNNNIELYILFEKSYSVIKGPLGYPEPTEYNVDSLLYPNSNVTLHSSDINDYGSFVRAYTDIEYAKLRVLTQFKAVFGYAASHIV